MDHDPAPRPPVTGLRRAVYLLAGLLFVGLAVLGALLPVLPTTPFVLLASYCFVRSSPALHRWLLRNRWFGPLLRDWQQHRGVRRRVKATALCVLPLALGTSLALAGPSVPVVLALAVLGLIGFVVVMRLPVIEDRPADVMAATPIPVPAQTGSCAPPAHGDETDPLLHRRAP